MSNLKTCVFYAISYTTHTFYGNSPQIRNDMSNLKVGQSANFRSIEPLYKNDLDSCQNSDFEHGYAVVVQREMIQYTKLMKSDLFAYTCSQEIKHLK